MELKIGYNTSIIEVNIDNYKKYDIVILPGVGSLRFCYEIY